MGFEASGNGAGAPQVVLPTTEVKPPPPARAPPDLVPVGRLVKLTFSTWRGLLPQLAAVALAETLIIWVVGLLLGSPHGLFGQENPLRPSPEALAWNFSVGYWVQSAITMALYFLAAGIAAELADRRLAGKPAALGGALTAGLRLAPDLLGGGLLLLLATYGGMLLLLVPGILWGLSFSMAGAAIVLEGKGAVEGLKRSRALARGVRWPLLGLYLLCGIATAVPTWIGLGLRMVSPLAGSLLMLAAGIVLGPILLVAPAVAFHEIRAAREGSSALEKVFE